jgi:rare lipoprotein A
MMLRLGAVICGALVLVYSLASTTQAEFSAIYSYVSTGNSYFAISQSTQIRNSASTGVTIIGVASTYNPYKPGEQSGGPETASGEPYDPSAWTAAIQTDLREQFGGVGYGKNYRPVFALVECADKHVIVKINDVGPLRSGRVIDFNEQTMRYFDPTLELGLIGSVEVTPLRGDDWTTGPLGG